MRQIGLAQPAFERHRTFLVGRIFRMGEWLTHGDVALSAVGRAPQNATRNPAGPLTITPAAGGLGREHHLSGVPFPAG